MGSKVVILSKWVGYDFSTAGGFLQKMPVYGQALATILISLIKKSFYLNP
jgi:hypothetical protein